MKKIEGILGMRSGTLSALFIDIGIRIAITLAILIIGFWIAKVLSKAVVKVIKKRDADESLVSFMRSLTSIG
ncbi:MAG: hypothetical protein ACJAXI_003610, partial [Crocinitomicaceae bacterium]